MPTFVGSDFALEEVRQLSVAALRVKFTQYPRALNPSNVDDALNPDNYTLLNGPNLNYVVGCATVDGDRQSIDVYLAAPLELGTWQLAVANIVEDSSDALMPPTTLPFLVTFTTTLDPLGHGAQNDEHVNIVRKFLNPALRGGGWNSMVAAIAAGDQRNADNARLAFNQLFLSSANGVYLDRRASDEGIERPKGVNMADPLFRKLAISVKTRKLTQEAILEVLEVFYGRDATRAYSDSAPALYALQDGDDLSILIDERQTVTVVFQRSHFSRIGMATAEEVAANITRTLRDFGSLAFAVVRTDPTTGDKNVRLYSGSLGLTSSIRVVGGRANTRLLFPTSLFTQTGGSPFATWNATLSPTTQGNLRFTMVAGTEYNLMQVHDGDLAYIYGDEFEPSNTNGTYEVQAVSVTYPGPVQWFEIANPLGVAHAGMVQVQFEDLMFFRPKRKTIYDNPRHVIVCENDDHLDVVIPATTEVVDRGPGLAAYLRDRAILQGPGFSLIRTGDGVVTIDVDQTHGLEVGNQVIVDGMLPTGEVPPTTTGTPSTNFAGADDNKSGTTNASIQSTSSQAGTYEGVFSRAVRTHEKWLLIVGGATTPDGLAFTPKNNVTVLQDVSEATLGNGGRQVAYKWTQVSNSGTHGFSGNHFQFRSFGASLLEDGRVLCTGGANGDDATGTPTSGWDMLTFIPPNAVSQQNGTLPAARAAHGQCSLNGGDAFVVGGWTVAGTPLATSLRFAVASATWSAKASMAHARMHPELVPITIGGLDFVLAIGGNTTSTNILDWCELYDVANDSWAPTGQMTYARVNFGVVKIPDGRVIVFGGRGYNRTRNVTSPQVVSTVEIYDPNTGLWSVLPPMRSGREFPVVAYLPTENAIYVTGGANGEFNVEILDVGKMKWKRSRAQIQTAHLVPTGGLIGDDIFTMVGGSDHGIATEKTNQIVVPGEDQFWLGAGINGVHRVEDVPDATHVVLHTREYDYSGNYNVARAGAYITPMGAEPAPENVPGPFSYDVKSGLAITATDSTTDTTFNLGEHYSSLHLIPTISVPDPALDFPDEDGWLVFNFGFKNQVGPVKYLGRLSDEDLILDAADPFTATLPAGATVRLLNGRVPFEPEPDHLVGNFYATGTAAGRVAAQKTIDDIVAAGKQILVSVIYPGDRGLGAEGFPQDRNYKLSDKVMVWGGDELDTEIPLARKGQ